MRWVWPLALVCAAACSSAPPPPVSKPLFQDGVLQRELTTKDAERYLRQATPNMDVCYRRELLNMAPKVSSYMLQITIHPDGRKATVEILKETVPNQVTLRGCLIEAIEAVDFPAHLGKVIKLKVPVHGE